VQIIQGQLADIKELLQDYRKAHGRYPSNDEGLSVLDNFESRLKMHFITFANPDADDVLDYDSGHPAGGFWAEARRNLQIFRMQNGHAPRSAKDLEFTSFDYYESRSLQGKQPPSIELEVAVTKNDNLLIPTHQGILSPWLLPYVYENRSNLDAAAFEFSPVNRDPNGRYSVCVDKGIYVYSVGAKNYAEINDRLRQENVTIQLVGMSFLLVAIALSILAIRAAEHRLKAGFMVTIAMGLSTLLGPGLYGLNTATCYYMIPFFSRRDPQMVVQQKDLLDKYRAAGVISEETYKKSLAAVEPVKPQEPAATKP
jgi:hypothetical protein